MSYDTPYACVTTDTGLASELVRVSPIFVRCGPQSRGMYADRRLDRARRSDARHERKTAGIRQTCTDYTSRVRAF